MTAHRAALKVAQQIHSTGIEHRWNNLGISLRALGELMKNAEMLRKAEPAEIQALAIEHKENDRLDWELSQNNLAVARGWLGAVTSASSITHIAFWL